MKISDIRKTYVTVPEAASILGISLQMVHALKDKPGFPSMEKLWKEYVMPRKELMEFAKGYTPKPGGKKKRLGR